MLENSKQTRFIPVTEWPKHHVWPTIGGLRHLIFHSCNGNGFNKVIVRAGRRVLLDEQAFFDWLSERREDKNNEK